MIRAHTVDQVRAAEAGLMATLPDGALMQRAAIGLAHAVLDLLGAAYGRRVLLLVGSGDNGGDALYAGVALARRGVAVEAWPLSDHVHEAGLAALRAVGGRVFDGADDLTGPPDIVLDGIVGIGGRAGLKPEAVRALEALDGVPVVAVDTPSGVDVDTGERPDDPAQHVTAALTVTFGTHKACHLVDPAAQACGPVHLVDIGLGPHLPDPAIDALQPADVAALVPRPGIGGQKYDRGVVGVRAGSPEYPGAALLSVSGAAAGLVGMVRYVGADRVGDVVREQHPEVVGPGRVQAWVVGSGGGEHAGDELAAALADGVPVLVDADALQHVEGPLPVPAVLTPHAGELAAMLGADRGEIEARPLHFVRAAAERYRCTVLLKGRRTLVCDGAVDLPADDRRVRVNTTGTAWLGTAGAGDVLGGLVGALLAAGLAPYDAASVGAWLHGAAATLASAGGPLVASQVARAVPEVVRGLPC